MYCRNCAHALADNAIACTKCGFDPRSESNYCPSCAAETHKGQEACTDCGAALTTKPISAANLLQGVDVGGLTKKPAILAAGIALIACMFPWVNMQTFMVKTGFSAFSLSTPVAMADTILSPSLVYLLPLALAGIIAAEFMPQLKKYRRIFALTAAILVVYAGIGLYQLANPSAPDPQALNDGGDFMNRVTSLARNVRGSVMGGAYSIGFGYYIALVATLASLFFVGLPSKK